MKNFKPTGILVDDVTMLFTMHERVEKLGHVKKVADIARKMAVQFGANEEDAFCAGLLHDIGNVFPNEGMEKVAMELDIDILPEEEQFPPILHQKISQVVAREIFKVTDENILSAIGCHTTLKKDADDFDKIIFIADKLSWDEKYSGPFLKDVLDFLEKSLLDKACACYLSYLWNQKNGVEVIHPWMKESYEQLTKNQTRS